MPMKRREMATYLTTIEVDNTLVGEFPNEQFLGFSPGSAFITVEGANVRIRWDGQDPSPTEGHLLFDGQSFSFDRPSQIRMFRVTGQTNSTATITMTLEGS